MLFLLVEAAFHTTFVQIVCQVQQQQQQQRHSNIIREVLSDLKAVSHQCAN